MAHVKLINVEKVDTSEQVYDEHYTKQKPTQELKPTAFRGMYGTLLEDKARLLKIDLNGKSVVALMESGASHCIMSKELYDQLPKVVIDTSRKPSLKENFRNNLGSR